MRSVFLRTVRRHQWVTNVTLYGCLYAGGDLLYQLVSTRGQRVDWTRTRNVAAVAFGFHGNFSFFWMRFLERRFPGNSAAMVLRKLVLDQSCAAPLAVSVFYTGVSFLEGKDDILQDWREKFLNTYKTGLMFWPFMQLLNFAFVPLYVRTTFTGCCAFVWATFLCFSRQSGDGTAGAALAWVSSSSRGLSTETHHEKMSSSKGLSTETHHEKMSSSKGLSTESHHEKMSSSKGLSTETHHEKMSSSKGLSTESHHEKMSSSKGLSTETHHEKMSSSKGLKDEKEDAPKDDRHTDSEENAAVTTET